MIEYWRRCSMPAWLTCLPLSQTSMLLQVKCSVLINLFLLHISPLCSGALKMYLRELPEPLLTYELYDSWVQAGTYVWLEDANDPDWWTFSSLLSGLKTVTPDCSHYGHSYRVCQKRTSATSGKFPGFLSGFLLQCRFLTCTVWRRYLMAFFQRLSQLSDVNKMGPANIALVIGPNLLWSRTELDTRWQSVQHIPWCWSSLCYAVLALACQILPLGPRLLSWSLNTSTGSSLKVQQLEFRETHVYSIQQASCRGCIAIAVRGSFFTNV